MANLILDVGNTRCKTAVMEGSTLLFSSSGDALSADALSDLCRRYDVRAAIASVVGRQPDFGVILPSSLVGRFHQLSFRSSLPVELCYDTPQTVGMDRVAAVVGARELCHSSPLLVVDAGSCITVDLLDGDNRYLGGAILPGIAMRFKALGDYTAALPLVVPSDGELDGSLPVSLTGSSTRASILSGVLNATLFEIQGFINEYKKQYPDIKLFLTGGNAVFFAKQLFFPNFAAPDLVYIGLNKILNMNV